MARPPRLDPGNVHGAAEVALVLRLGAPAGLTGGLAGRSATRRRTVILVMAGTWGRTKKIKTTFSLAAGPPAPRVPPRRGASSPQRMACSPFVSQTTPP